MDRALVNALRRIRHEASLRSLRELIGPLLLSIALAVTPAVGVDAQAPTPVRPGLSLVVALVTPLSSTTQTAGDRVEAVVRNATEEFAVPIGSQVVGRVVRVAPPSGGWGAAITLHFDSLTILGNRTYPIDASVIEVLHTDAFYIGGGAIFANRGVLNVPAGTDLRIRNALAAASASRQVPNNSSSNPTTPLASGNPAAGRGSEPSGRASRTTQDPLQLSGTIWFCSVKSRAGSGYEGFVYFHPSNHVKYMMTRKSEGMGFVWPPASQLAGPPSEADYERMARDPNVFDDRDRWASRPTEARFKFLFIDTTYIMQPPSAGRLSGRVMHFEMQPGPGGVFRPGQNAERDDVTIDVFALDPGTEVGTITCDPRPGWTWTDVIAAALKTLR